MGNSREPTKWRFLVIGCGSIGKRHIENLRRLGVNDIIGFDTQSARLAKVAGGYGIETVASSGGGVGAEAGCLPDYRANFAAFGAGAQRRRARLSFVYRKTVVA